MGDHSIDTTDGTDLARYVDGNLGITFRAWRRGLLRRQGRDQWPDPPGSGVFHAVLDGAGGPVLEDALAHLHPHGVAVTYGCTAGVAELGLGDLLGHTVVGLVHSDPEDERGTDIGVLAGPVADGRLRPQIGSVRAWEALPDVLDALERGSFRGQAVLTIGDPAELR